MRDKFRESGTTRRPCTFEGKAKARREEKGKRTGGGPGVRSTACGESERRSAYAKGLWRDKSDLRSPGFRRDPTAVRAGQVG